MHVNSVGVVIGTYLHFDRFLHNTATAITMATVVVITTRRITTTAATITVTSLDSSVGRSVDGATEAARQIHVFHVFYI